MRALLAAVTCLGLLAGLAPESVSQDRKARSGSKELQKSKKKDETPTRKSERVLRVKATEDDAIEKLRRKIGDGKVGRDVLDAVRKGVRGFSAN